MTQAIGRIAVLIFALAAACTAASAQTKVRLAVGGQTALF